MYFDPGFGGMLLQVAVAVVAAGGAILFSFRRKLRVFFSKDKGENANNIPKRNAKQIDDNETIDLLAADEKKVNKDS